MKIFKIYKILWYFIINFNKIYIEEIICDNIDEVDCIKLQKNETNTTFASAIEID